MKILLFLLKGFEMMEASVFTDVMGWAKNDFGFDIDVVTCGFHKQVISSFHVPVMVNKTIHDIYVDDYAALAIPGGFEAFGYYEEAYHQSFLNLIRAFDYEGRIIASICAGALPLGKSGILKGRKATTYHLRNGYRQKQLKDFGVEIVDKPIVISKNVITSNSPKTAPGVAFKLLEKLTTREEMEVVKKAMGY